MNEQNRCSRAVAKIFRDYHTSWQTVALRQILLEYGFSLGLLSLRSAKQRVRSQLVFLASRTPAPFSTRILRQSGIRNGHRSNETGASEGDRGPIQGPRHFHLRIRQQTLSSGQHTLQANISFEGRARQRTSSVPNSTRQKRPSLNIFICSAKI
jgi:hypothetical protein